MKLTEGFPAGKVRRLMKACAMMGLEGVVMKRKGSISRSGFRSPDWLKVPIRHREEFVIGGYLSGSRGFYTLLLGQYDSRGRIAYAGYCGTGLSEGTRAVIFVELRSTLRKRCPFASVPILRGDFGKLPDVPVRWVRPSIVVQVEYRQRSGTGLRHAVMKGIRPDEPARQVVQSPQLEHGPF